MKPGILKIENYSFNTTRKKIFLDVQEQFILVMHPFLGMTTKQMILTARGTEMTDKRKGQAKPGFK